MFDYPFSVKEKNRTKIQISHVFKKVIDEETIRMLYNFPRVSSKISVQVTIHEVNIDPA